MKCFNSIHLEKPCFGDSFVSVGAMMSIVALDLLFAWSYISPDRGTWMTGQCCVYQYLPHLAWLCSDTANRLWNLTVSAIQYYKLPVCSEHAHVCSHLVCVHDVNMQKVNAYAPIMSLRIHSAWLGAVLELVRWNCNPQLRCSNTHFFHCMQIDTLGLSG